jgi:dephospho-CoA kinase
MAIMRTQSSRDERLAAADDVIVNDAGIAELHEKVAQLHEMYLTLAA